MKNLKPGAYDANAATPGLLPKLLPYDASPTENTQTNASIPQMPQSIVSVRPERSFSVKVYDGSVDN